MAIVHMMTFIWRGLQTGLTVYLYFYAIILKSFRWIKNGL
jgi:hypothetical protein